MNVANIKKVDVANGPGVRTSLFVSGCTHRCPGCFNEVAWDFSYGQPYTSEIEEEILQSLARPYIEGFSLLGGEPFEPQNQRELVHLLRRIKTELPNKSVWCYTGYLLDEQLLKESRARCEVTDEMLSYIDILIDGRFMEEQKNLNIKFRGSENQRIIKVPETLRTGNIVLWEEMEGKAYE